MKEPNQQPTKKRYYIQTVSGNDSPEVLYIVTDGPGGVGVMLINSKSISTISEKGWLEKPHKDFIKAELSEDQKNVLIYYQNQDHPVALAIPPKVDKKFFELTEDHIDKVLEQMKSKGLYFDDSDAEYFHGTNTTYCYDPEKKSYKVTYIDVIVGSFCNVELLSYREIKNALMSCASLHDLRKQGFDL